MLFHRVPANLVGTELMPLNLLRVTYPELYKTEVRKYKRRPHVPQNYIPQLDCTWGDVLFFAAVSPAVLLRTLQTCGFPSWPCMPSFEIPLARLDLKRLVVCHPSRVEKPGQDYYTYFHASDLARYATISGTTRKYYRHCAITQERPFLYNSVVQILYAGSLDVVGLQVVE
jgi:hypothetical protein